MLREIRKVKSDLEIKLQLFKMKLHQDFVKDLSDLSLVEKEKTACNLATKALIYIAGSEAFRFTFDLSSIHL